MCGVLGVINLANSNRIAESILQNMSNAMTHRGPDGSGEWINSEESVGLAHRRLSIIDLSEAGRQPMSSHSGNIVVTFNGEIYNFPALKDGLEKLGYQFKSSSDTEVIIYLYEEHGEKFYEHLDGDFAIGLWDCVKKKLILVRDRAGVKPLYYSYFDGRFMFSSEMKALLRYPNMPAKIDDEAFYHYLSYLVAPPPRTLIDGICKLPAASVLILNQNDLYEPNIYKYWLPEPTAEKQSTFEELDEELDQLFHASVEKRLQSDVPVGVLFSGGVDSTLNLRAFQKLVDPELVKTFTVGMSDAGEFHDDSAIAKEMAKRFNTEHHEIKISERDLIDASVELARLQDEPVSDPVAVPLYFVTKLAKEAGVTVLQAGEGADELFCGYDNYRRFLRHQEYWEKLDKMPKFAVRALQKLTKLRDTQQNRKIRDVLARHCNDQKLFMSSAVAYYELEKRSVLSQDYLMTTNDYDSFDVVAPFYEELNKYHPGASMLQAIVYIELQLRLPELLLMRTDKMAMANSVEIRVPFLDRDIIDFAMRVPDEYKLRHGISKEPIKNLALKYADRRDIYRPKTGFGVPIQEWFAGELGEKLKDYMASSSPIANYFDADIICRNLESGMATVNDAFQMWVVYNLFVWFESLKQ